VALDDSVSSVNDVESGNKAVTHTDSLDPTEPPLVFDDFIAVAKSVVLSLLLEEEHGYEVSTYHREHLSDDPGEKKISLDKKISFVCESYPISTSLSILVMTTRLVLGYMVHPDPSIRHDQYLP
jgi:hypothetical protein